MSVRCAKSKSAILGPIEKIGRQEWNALLREDDSPFIDWDWLHALEASGSAARAMGWAPLHLVVRDERNSLIAACPLYLKSDSMGEFVFDHGWAEAAEHLGIDYYPKLLVGVPFTPHTGRRFLTAPGAGRSELIRLLGQALVALCGELKLSSVHVNFCEVDEAQALATVGFAERHGYQYHWRNPGFASFEDYLGSLNSKRRSAVRHERAALEAQNVSIRVYTGEQIEDRLWGSMYRLYLSTVDKYYWGRRYLTRKFFELMRGNFRRYLCLVCAWQGRELVAGTFNVQKAGVLYGRYWGCFKELKFLHFNVCYYGAIEHCIAQHLDRFEPGAGGEYKWLRGFDPTLTRSAHFITHPALRKAVRSSVARERFEVRRWIEAGREHSQLRARPTPSNG